MTTTSTSYQGGIAITVGEAMLKELSALGLRNRGVKDRRDLYVINNTIMTALLVECVFVDSGSDMVIYYEQYRMVICKFSEVNKISSLKTYNMIFKNLL